MKQQDLKSWFKSGSPWVWLNAGAVRAKRSDQGFVLDTVRFPEETGITDFARYRGRSIPATGALLKTEDSDDKQLSLI